MDDQVNYFKMRKLYTDIPNMLVKRNTQNAFI